MNRRINVLTAGCVVGLAMVGTATAQTRVPYNENPNAIRVRFGEFRPDGESLYWQQRELDFFGTAGDWEDSSWGVDYFRMLNERLGLVLGISQWEGADRTSFRDFVDNAGRDILHDASLEINRFDVGLVYYFLRRNARLSPYIGGGGSFHDYTLEERGDFIDFDTFDVVSGTFGSVGDAFGGFWMVGLEVSVSKTIGIFGEARWNSARDTLGGDFSEFGKIDLGGRDVSVGASLRF